MSVDSLCQAVHIHTRFINLDLSRSLQSLNKTKTVPVMTCFLALDVSWLGVWSSWFETSRYIDITYCASMAFLHNICVLWVYVITFYNSILLCCILVFNDCMTVKYLTITHTLPLTHVLFTRKWGTCIHFCYGLFCCCSCNIFVLQFNLQVRLPWAFWNNEIYTLP